MKVNELRIGNYVNALENNCNDGMGLVCISGNQLSFFDNISNIKDLVEPIPLTEEWLLNFGLEQVSSYFGIDGFWFLRSFELTGDFDGFSIYLGCNYKEADKFYITPFNSSDKKVFIKHVHQLQNLYFALTGVELILSESVEI